MKIKEAFVGIVNAISNKINLKQDIIEDLETIRSGAALGATSIQSLGSITDLIPEQASDENQLADKAFVNSSISTATATFRGTYNLVNDLSLTTSATNSQIAAALSTSSVDKNDYCYVQIPTADVTPTEILKVVKFKYDGTNWIFEYELNNSGYTAALWAAINSGITSSLVTKLGNLPTATELATSLAGKQATISDLETIRSGAALGATAVQTETDPVFSASPAAGITNTNISNWDDANSKKHTHSNKTVLDGITSEKVTSWDNKYDKPLAGIPASDLEQSVLDSLDYVLNNRSTTEKFDTINKLTEPGKKGIAHIEKISGNTIAWNQLAKITISSFYNITITDNNDGSYTLNGHFNDSNGRKLQLCTAPLGHKVYLSGCGWIQAYDGSTPLSSTPFIFTMTNSTELGIRCYPGMSLNNYTIRPVCIDLTLIYGAGHEPSTPEQFEADYQKWFGKPLIYEPYDEGSLKSVQMSGLKTTGFNQYNPTSGTAKLIGGNQYQITGTYTALTLDGETITPDSNGKFTPTIGGTLTVTGGSTDTCVHLVWSGTKDGTYEPYEEHTISLPTTTMTGKLNGEGESVVIFPDGMKGVNDIHDEIYYVGGKTYAVKRVGRVDLGSLGWSYKTTGTGTHNGQYPYFTSDSIQSLKYNDNTIITTSKYIVVTNGYIWGDGEDKAIAQRNFAVNKGVIIRDSSYSDTATFKTAMSGVYLDYELAAPLVYEVEYNGNPIKSIDYQIKEYGVETLIVPSGGIAADITVKYNDSIENRVNDTIIDLANTITDLGFGEVSYDYGVLSFTPNDNVRNEIVISESDYENLLNKDANTIYNVI